MGFARSIYSIRLLRIVLSAFFIVLGIFGILRTVDEGFFTLNTQSNLEILFGVIELICGLLLLIGFFAFKSRNAIFWGGFIVFIFWLVRIVLTKVIWCLKISSQSISFHFYPNINVWLLALVTELVIAVALLVVIRRYD